MDNKVELGKILGPAGLTVGKDFGCGKVFQVLMIHDHINRSTGTFKEVSPDTEGLKDCEQFFVMGVIVEFQGAEGAGMESHRVDFTGIGLDGEDGTQSIIGGIGFYDDRFIGDPVGQDRCRDESGFQGLEEFPGSIGKVPWNTLEGSIFNPSLERMKPRYLMVSSKKQHLSRQVYRPFSQRQQRTSQTCFLWSTGLLE